MRRQIPMNENDEGGGGGGGETPHWSEALPESVRGWDEVKNSETPEKFYEQVTNMRTRMGRSITIPGEDAGEEQVAEFYTKLKEKVPGLMPAPDFSSDEATASFFAGIRPEKAEDYATPEGMVIPPERMDILKNIAFEQGLHKSQFAGFISKVVKGDTEVAETQMTVVKDGQERLKIEWGEAHEQRMNSISNYLDKTEAPKELVTAHKEGKLGGETLKWLYSNLGNFKEGGSEFHDQGHGSDRMTPGEAQDKINEMRENRKHAYWDSMHVDHQRAMKKMIELMKVANPGAPSDPNDLRRPTQAFEG